MGLHQQTRTLVQNGSGLQGRLLAEEKADFPVGAHFRVAPVTGVLSAVDPV